MQEILNDVRKGQFISNQDVKVSNIFAFVKLLVLTKILGTKPEDWDNDIENIDFKSQECQQCLNLQMIQQELKSKLDRQIYEKVSCVLQTLHRELQVCNENCDNIFLINIIMFVLQVYDADMKLYIIQSIDMELEFLTQISTKLLYAILRELLAIHINMHNIDFELPESISAHQFYQQHKNFLISKPLKKLFIDVLPFEYIVKLLQICFRYEQPIQCLYYFNILSIDYFFYTIYDINDENVIHNTINERLCQQLNAITSHQFDLLLNRLARHFGIQIAPAGKGTTQIQYQNVKYNQLDNKKQQQLSQTLQYLHDNIIFYLQHIQSKLLTNQQIDSTKQLTNLLQNLFMIRDTLLLISQSDQVAWIESISDIFASIQQSKQLISTLSIL